MEEGTSSASPRQLVSAGGVVYRQRDGRTEILLCGRPGLWGLPKGAPEAEESLTETAQREVREETGLEVKVGQKIGTIAYNFLRNGVLYHKTVHHYLMRPQGGSLEQHDPEYEVVQWFSAEEACRTLTYPNEREIVCQALSMLSQGDKACQS